MTKGKKSKVQTMIYKQLKIEQREPHRKPGVNPGVSSFCSVFGTRLTKLIIKLTLDGRRTKVINRGLPMM